MGRIALRLSLALTLSAAALARAGAVELHFTKGDTREGSRVEVRVDGDSLHFRRVEYSPGSAAAESFRGEALDVRRKAALERILGDMPRFRVFGSCFGKRMRYYMVETPEGRLYRSVPELSGRCYADEPGIWSLLEDLDGFLVPPEETPPLPPPAS